MLGLEIGHVEVFGLIEHVFPEQAVKQAGHRDGAAVMEAAHLEPLCQLQGLTGALGIDLLLNARFGVEIIDGGEMQKMINLADEGLQFAVADAEQGVGHVANHGNGAILTNAPVGQQVGYPLEMGCPHQEMHPTIWTLQQFFNQPAADEAAATCDEIIHGIYIPY